MNPETCAQYISILEEELVPAMGCTEPIAVAYAAALARDALGCMPEHIEVLASANIIKNVKSVIVPNTGSLRGLPAAAAAGIVAGDAGRKLEVLSGVTAEQIEQIKSFTQTMDCKVGQSHNEHIFYIEIILTAKEHGSRSVIAGSHTGVTLIERDGEVLYKAEPSSSGGEGGTDHSVLTVEGIVEFADSVAIDDIRAVISRQIEYNTAIAEEGLRGDYGANIGSILLQSYGSGVHNRAKAMAAAGSDARMNGCEKPVVINSGSGNQGLTTSLPVIVYAEELGSDEDTLYRALAVANLVTIHLKSGIGPLSAYCGATSAGAGAAAGITYLYGGRFNAIAHTIVNALAINSGMICDGAKASCAAKIASAVESGLLSLQMQMHGSEFYGGEGIVVKGVENTIRNVSAMARDGMRLTDEKIIELMLNPSV